METPANGIFERRSSRGRSIEKIQQASRPCEGSQSLTMFIYHLAKVLHSSPQSATGRLEWRFPCFHPPSPCLPSRQNHVLPVNSLIYSTSKHFGRRRTVRAQDSRRRTASQPNGVPEPKIRSKQPHLSADSPERGPDTEWTP